MDERFKNLVIVGLIVVLIAGIALVFSRSGSSGSNPKNPGVLPGNQDFQAEFSEMQKTWLNAGINAVALHSSTANLENLDTEALESLKQQLDSFSARAVTEPARRLALIYSVLIQKKLQDKKSSEMIARLDSVTDGCASLPEFKQLSGDMTSSLSLSVEYLEKVNSFVELFPEEAEFIGMYSNTEYPSNAETSIQQVQESVALLEEACR